MRLVKWVVYVSLLIMAALIVPAFFAAPVSAQPPSAPYLASATPSDSQVVLVWEAPDPGDGIITNYNVSRGTTHGGETFLTTVGNVLTYTDTGLTNGLTYYYQINAVNDTGGGGDLSNEAAATPDVLPLAPDLTSATPGDTQITLTWIAPSSNGGSAITGYDVYRGTTHGGETLLATLGIVLTYTDIGLTNGETYYYEVRAMNLMGGGDLSNELSATPATAPSASTLTSATPGNAQVVLVWTAASDGGSAITNYKVYRGTTSGGETLLTTVGNVLTYTSTGLANGQIYFYKVSAVNNVGEGPQSNEAYATPATIPSAPSPISATPGNAQVVLVWTTPSSNGGSVIINYKVYRGTTSGGETLLTTLGNVLTYTSTGLTNGQIYYYKVSAVNSAGEGGFSNEASATPATLPSAPTLNSATPGNAQVTLTWTAPTSNGGAAIAYYIVYRNSVDIAHPTSTSYTHTGLTNGVTYYYQVSAVNSVGAGAKSNEVSAKPVGSPLAPRNLQASPGNAFINLSWQGPTSDGGSAITNYQVWRGSSSGTETFLADAGLNLWFNNAGLTNGQTYYYIIKAENAQGLGSSSNEVSATPSQVVTVPTAPQSLTATTGNGQVVLTWSVPANNGGAAVTNYPVYRGTTSGGESLITTLGNVLTYTDTGLTNGQIYYYKVTAVNGVGESTMSNEAYATPTAVPSAPTLISATPSNGQVVLIWTAPSSNESSAITNYKVLRGVTSGSEVEFQQVGIVLNWTDTTVTNGLTYYYQIQAVNAIGPGALSNEISAKPMGSPTAPQSLQANPSDAYINLTWQAPASDGGNTITNYKVWRGNSSGTETFLAKAGLKLWFNDTGLTNGQTYYYKVSAENAAFLGPNSSEVFATAGQEAALPSAPRDLVAHPGNANVTLTWSVPSNDHGKPITYYKIYRSTTPNDEVAIAMVGNVLAYIDTYVTIGQIYYYKVSAMNDVGEGPQSDEVSTTVGVPDAPWGLKAIWGNEQIALSWNAVNYTGPGILSYHLFRDGTQIWNDTVTSHLDTVLSNGAVYYYTVAASNGVGWSVNSSGVSATPQGPPTAPIGLHAEAGNGSMELNWTAPTYVGIGTTEYHLFRNGTLIWSGTELEYIDMGLMTSVTYSYYIVAENSIGWGTNSTVVEAIPLSGENQSSTPWTPIATAGFVAIGAMPLIVIAYKMMLYRRKVVR